jgi:hypothetical protein
MLPTDAEPMAELTSWEFGPQVSQQKANLGHHA